MKTETIRTGLVDKEKKSLMTIPSIFHKFSPWGPEPAGPARATVQMQKQKQNIEIEALKTKTIRTALKFLKKQKKSTLELFYDFILPHVLSV